MTAIALSRTRAVPKSRCSLQVITPFGAVAASQADVPSDDCSLQACIIRAYSAAFEKSAEVTRQPELRAATSAAAAEAITAPLPGSTTSLHRGPHVQHVGGKLTSGSTVHPLSTSDASDAPSDMLLPPNGSSVPSMAWRSSSKHVSSKHVLSPPQTVSQILAAQTSATRAAAVTASRPQQMHRHARSMPQPRRPEGLQRPFSIESFQHGGLTIGYDVPDNAAEDADDSAPENSVQIGQVPHTTAGIVNPAYASVAGATLSTLQHRNPLYGFTAQPQTGSTVPEAGPQSGHHRFSAHAAWLPAAEGFVLDKAVPVQPQVSAGSTLARSSNASSQNSAAEAHATVAVHSCAVIDPNAEGTAVRMSSKQQAPMLTAQTGSWAMMAPEVRSTIFPAPIGTHVPPHASL